MQVTLTMVSKDTGTQLGAGIEIDLVRSMIYKDPPDMLFALQAGMSIALVTFLECLIHRLEPNQGLPFHPDDKFEVALGKCVDFFGERLEDAAALMVHDIYSSEDKPQAPPKEYDWEKMFRSLLGDRPGNETG